MSTVHTLPLESDEQDLQQSIEEIRELLAIKENWFSNRMLTLYASSSVTKVTF